MDQSLNNKDNPVATKSTPVVNTATQPSVQSNNKNKKVASMALCALVLVLLLGGGIWYLLSTRNNPQQASITNYFSPQPTTSATPSDLTAQESTMDASLKQLDSDQQSINQAINDKGDNFSSL